MRDSKGRLDVLGKISNFVGAICLKDANACGSVGLADDFDCVICLTLEDVS